jgi:antitoxin (DNA-binding transcriptional repressor) of toxin-antitoxin stability system
MSIVSVREFSRNPSAMFTRAERGETIEISRHDKVIATLVPAQQKKRSRIEELEASGALRRSGKTTDDLDTFTQIDVDTDVDPLQLLLEDRYGEREWERELRLEMERRGKAAGEPG